AVGVLAAPPLEHRTLPDLADALGAYVAEIGAPGDIEPADLHLSAAVNVQAMEGIRARLAFRLVEVWRGIGGPSRVERGVGAPGEELPLDGLGDALLQPEAHDLVHGVAHDVLIDDGHDDVGGGLATIALRHHVTDGPEQVLPVEASTHDGVGRGI